MDPSVGPVSKLVVAEVAAAEVVVAAVAVAAEEVVEVVVWFELNDLSYLIWIRALSSSVVIGWDRRAVVALAEVGQVLACDLAAVVHMIEVRPSYCDSVAAAASTALVGGLVICMLVLVVVILNYIFILALLDRYGRLVGRRRIKNINTIGVHY
jgi:hypothetical protein